MPVNGIKTNHPLENSKNKIQILVIVRINQSVRKRNQSRFLSTLLGAAGGAAVVDGLVASACFAAAAASFFSRAVGAATAVAPATLAFGRPRLLVTTVPVVAVDTVLILLATRCFAVAAVPLLAAVGAASGGGGGIMARPRVEVSVAVTVLAAAALVDLPLAARVTLACSTISANAMVAVVTGTAAAAVVVGFRGDIGRMTPCLRGGAGNGRMGE